MGNIEASRLLDTRYMDLDETADDAEPALFPIVAS